MDTAWRSIEEVPCYFSNSSIHLEVIWVKKDKKLIQIVYDY